MLKGVWDSVVSIADYYRLVSLVFESQRGQDFLYHLDQPQVPHSLLYGGYQVFFLGVKRLRYGTYHPPTHSLTSCTEAKERVELLLFPPLCAFGMLYSEIIFNVFYCLKLNLRVH
jgi:hypothetical protein